MDCRIPLDSATQIETPDTTPKGRESFRVLIAAGVGDVALDVLYAHGRERKTPRRLGSSRQGDLDCLVRQ